MEDSLLPTITQGLVHVVDGAIAPRHEEVARGGDPAQLLGWSSTMRWDIV